MIYVLALFIPPLAIAIQKGPARHSFWINLLLYLSIFGTGIAVIHGIAVISGARAVEGYINDQRNAKVDKVLAGAAETNLESYTRRVASR